MKDLMRAALCAVAGAAWCAGLAGCGSKNDPIAKAEKADAKGGRHGPVVEDGSGLN